MALTTIDDRGLKTPIDLLDNEKIRFGTGNDLEVYHNGSNSYQLNTTGELTIGTGGVLRLTNAAANESYIKCWENAAVEIYYDNDRKFRTISSGILVETATGDAYSQVYAEEDDSSSDAIFRAYTNNNQAKCYLMFGDSDDAFVGGFGYYNSTDKLYVYSGNASNWSWDSSGNFENNSDSSKLKLGASDDLQIYHDGSDSYVKHNGTGNFYVQTSEASVEDLYLQAGNDVYIRVQTGEIAIKAIGDGSVELYHNNVKTFETIADGITLYGPENTNCNINMQADEGDDNDDKWRIAATVSNYLAVLNYASGGWETSIEANGNGNVELYFDNSLKFKTNSAGAQVYGNMYLTGDSYGAYFGAGNDLQIYHDGSHSYIDNTTGTLHIRDDSVIHFASIANEDLAKFTANGAVELYYDNSKKLETESWGVTISGSLHLDDGAPATSGITIGNGNDLQIYHNGSHSFLENSTGGIYGRSDEILLQSNTGNENYVIATLNGAVELYYDGTKKLNTSSEGVRVGESLFSYGSYFEVSHSGNQRTATFINNNNASGDEVLRTVNRDNADNTSSYHYIATRHGHSDKLFIYGNGNVVNSNNSYGNMSDEKLKENIIDAKSQWDDIKNIKIRNFNFKESTGQATHKQIGVIAQEVEAVSPGLVYETPDRDVVNDKQLETKTKVVQYSVLYIKAVKALQEAITRIETLETEVAALKAK